MAKDKLKRDPRPGRWSPLYREVFNSSAYLALPFSARDVYCALLVQVDIHGHNNGALHMTAADAAKRGIGSKTTLSQALVALEAVGLVSCTYRGGLRAGNREASSYRLTELPVYANDAKSIKHQAASNEWRAISSVTQGERLIKAAIEDARERNGTSRRNESEAPSVQKITKSVQKMDRERPSSGRLRMVTGTDSGPAQKVSVQKLDRGI